MNYETWVKTVPAEITGDSLWKMEAYRLALFAADLGWHDVTKLAGDRRTLDLAGQLYRAVGSVEANISEGYSRGSGRDRARFYEYALGSARESRGWYYKGRYVLGDAVNQASPSASHADSSACCWRWSLTSEPTAPSSKEDNPTYQPEQNHEPPRKPAPP